MAFCPPPAIRTDCNPHWYCSLHWGYYYYLSLLVSTILYSSYCGLYHLIIASGADVTKCWKFRKSIFTCSVSTAITEYSPVSVRWPADCAVWLLMGLSSEWIKVADLQQSESAHLSFSNLVLDYPFILGLSFSSTWICSKSLLLRPFYRYT